ncbi:hypothetical protein R3P38DRAFT_3243113 [Favolaschia claudopus]|uniref:Uncharacterized protein n=1 Tax=Favolaschia claudopus TaxID=2862362 RepID=A0AAV9Z3C0_9AGAR
MLTWACAWDLVRFDQKTSYDFRPSFPSPPLHLLTCYRKLFKSSFFILVLNQSRAVAHVLKTHLSLSGSIPSRSLHPCSLFRTLHRLFHSLKLFPRATLVWRHSIAPQALLSKAALCDHLYAPSDLCRRHLRPHDSLATSSTHSSTPRSLGIASPPSTSTCTAGPSVQDFSSIARNNTSAHLRGSHFLSVSHSSAQDRLHRCTTDAAPPPPPGHPSLDNRGAAHTEKTLHGLLYPSPALVLYLSDCKICWSFSDERHAATATTALKL